MLMERGRVLPNQEKQVEEMWPKLEDIFSTTDITVLAKAMNIMNERSWDRLEHALQEARILRPKK